TNPLGFRLGINKNYNSNWFAQPKIYSKFITEDKRVRDCIDAYVSDRVRDSDSRDSTDGIARVGIQRKTDLLLVKVRTESPAVLIKSQGGGIEQLREGVQRALSEKIGRVRVSLVGIPEPYGEPDVLAKYISMQLEGRVAFRRTMKKAIELAGKNGREGIKIQIAGRLNGTEIARTEWAREGRVPLQTLRAEIDYCYYPARTIYGVLGIKVWVLKDGSGR
uniref:Small ribosomal subunit protein uS3c n=1 Tax=Selaginella lyallii TaxID=137159 RepID=A0A481ZJN2_9TRAC|nr:ribosomal protein S3 [Selaginella lyallii]QBL02090.1 ribosomal protein S3 [Selaginella lyallii]